MRAWRTFAGSAPAREANTSASPTAGESNQDLVGDLASLARAVSPDQGDVLAHLFQYRLDLVEGTLRAAAHDGERRLLGADLAAGHRRVEIRAAERLDPRREILRGDRRDRAHVDDRLAGTEAVGDAVLAEQRGLDVRCVRHHDDDGVGALGDFPRRFADVSATGQIGGDWRAVKEIELMSGVDEMPRHGPAHDAEPDESDLRHIRSP